MKDFIFDKDISLQKPYPNEHACRFVNPNAFDMFRRDNCFRRSDGKCIDYIFGRRKSDGKWAVQAFRYPMSVWTEADAKANCKEHEGILFEPGTGEHSSDVDEQFMQKLNDRLKELNEKFKK